jgi:hypothetical protein
VDTIRVLAILMIDFAILPFRALYYDVTKVYSGLTTSPARLLQATRVIVCDLILPAIPVLLSSQFKISQSTSIFAMRVFLATCLVYAVAWAPPLIIDHRSNFERLLLFRRYVRKQRIEC